ncbi:MAG: SGNH/GDSL hydrolase family protein [Deltaproteobacteria bacterium]
MKIMIFGNSVVNHIRPPREKTEKIYGYVVIDMLRKVMDEPIELVNLGWGSAMVNDFSIFEFTNRILQHYPDVIIFNYGINESVPRVIPRKTWSFFVEPSIKKRVIRRCTYAIISRIAPYLIRLFKCRSWMSLNLFRKEYEERIRLINKELSSLIVVMGIGKASERVENCIPRANIEIEKYNNCLKDICSKNKNCVFIDCWDLEPYMPDGIHFDSNGHRIAAERIVSQIIEYSRGV